MASFFKNSVVKEIGTVPVRVAQTTPASRITVIGLSLANLTEDVLTVSVSVKDDTSVTGYYIKDVLIAPQSSLRVVNGGEKFILAPSNELYISSSVSDSIDAIVSYVEIL
jgi:hypothetical protein